MMIGQIGQALQCFRCQSCLECLDKRRIGEIGFTFIAAGGEHCCAVGRCPRNKRFRQPRFANPWLSFNDEQTAVWPDLLVELLHLVAFIFTANQRGWGDKVTG